MSIGEGYSNLIFLTDVDENQFLTKIQLYCIGERKKKQVPRF